MCIWMGVCSTNHWDSWHTINTKARYLSNPSTFFWMILTEQLLFLFTLPKSIYFWLSRDLGVGFRLFNFLRMEVEYSLASWLTGWLLAPGHTQPLISSFPRRYKLWPDRISSPNVPMLHTLNWSHIKTCNTWHARKILTQSVSVP